MVSGFTKAWAPAPFPPSAVRARGSRVGNRMRVGSVVMSGSCAATAEVALCVFLFFFVDKVDCVIIDCRRL